MESATIDIVIALFFCIIGAFFLVALSYLCAFSIYYVRERAWDGVADDYGNNQLLRLLDQRRWDDAILRVRRRPREANCGSAMYASPLALACRLGAPIECTRAILKAAPEVVRSSQGLRGTPLHELLYSDFVDINVMALLLKADEEVYQTNTEETPLRACLVQDLDGFTPLHLLIRRKFHAHILRSYQDPDHMELLRMLVKSCPAAVVLPDRGEYSKPPIIYALKVHIYAPLLGSVEETHIKVEAIVTEMVQCMLSYCPDAATCVFSGYRGTKNCIFWAL